MGDLKARLRKLETKPGLRALPDRVEAMTDAELWRVVVSNLPEDDPLRAKSIDQVTDAELEEVLKRR